LWGSQSWLQPAFSRLSSPERDVTLLDLTLPLSLGLVSSLHCAQMCGPIVLSYSMAGRSSPAGHLCYNAGRIATYSLLGAAAGGAGGAMGLLGRLAGIQQAASLIAGCLMLLAGVLLSGAVPAQSLVRIDRLGLSRLYCRTAGKLMLSTSPFAKLALGLALGFLPCGLLYAALLKAMATGSAAAGAFSMAAFGLGTAGALLAIGIFSSTLKRGLGRWSGLLSAASVAAMGLFLIWRGVAARVPAMSCHAGA
jgi:sulfite exporter TauE/SafE